MKMPEQNIRLIVEEDELPERLQMFFFPVEAKPLYWEEEPEFMGKHKLNLCDPLSFAIVDMERKKVFAPVSKSYLLITNKEAYEFGFEIGEMLFHLESRDDFKCVHAVLSANRAVCHIDMCRKIDLAQPHINDDWCSYMRITNSYNRTKKLEYVIGFYNVKHGYGFLDDSIAISANMAHYSKFNSYKQNIIKQIKSRKYSIDQVEQNFIKKMTALRNITLSKESILPMFCRVFGIHKKKNINASEKVGLKNTKYFIEEKATLYTNKYDQNAYALLNVFAEYEYQYDYSSLRFLLKSDQFKLGKWVDDLIEKSKSEGFSIIKYIGEEASNAAEWLRTLK